MAMNIVTKKLTELTPYDKNPRKNDKAVKYVAESIKQFGFKVPVVIDKDGVIVCGHTRYKAAKKLGMAEVPCIIADDLTPEQIKAFRLADNKVGEYSEWDFDLLGGELKDILNIDMDALGFEDTLVDDDEEGTEDEFEPDVPEEPRSKRGQIYLLGEHVLMCGDSTSAEDVAKLMGGQEADMVVTDPPYNVDYTGKTKKALKIENDSMDPESFRQFLRSCFENMAGALKPGGAFYVWYASREHCNFENALGEAGLTVRQQLIWNKNTIILGRQDYQWKHEPCLYGWKDGAAHYFIDDRTQATVYEDKGIEPKKMKKEELVRLVEDMLSDKVSTTIINEDKPAVSDLHPTMKPIRLIARQIRNSSKAGETVLDLFGGSGSTLIACQQLGRKCRMMEFDPRYTDVIIDRGRTSPVKRRC